MLSPSQRSRDPSARAMYILLHVTLNTENIWRYQNGKKRGLQEVFTMLLLIFSQAIWYENTTGQLQNIALTSNYLYGPDTS